MAESTEEVTKLRPVRLVKEDGIIRPYDPTESQGFDLFLVSLFDFFFFFVTCQAENSVVRTPVSFRVHRKQTPQNSENLEHSKQLFQLASSCF